MVRLQLETTPYGYRVVKYTSLGKRDFIWVIETVEEMYKSRFKFRCLWYIKNCLKKHENEIKKGILEKEASRNPLYAAKLL